MSVDPVSFPWNNWEKNGKVQISEDLDECELPSMFCSTPIASINHHVVLPVLPQNVVYII